MISKGRRRYTLRSKKTAYLFLLPGLLGSTLFVFIPMADVLVRSFQSAVSRSWVGLGNYRQVLTNHVFWLAVKNSFRFVAVCLPVLVGVGFFIALILHDKVAAHGGRTVKSMLLLPMAIPTATVVLVWKMLFTQGGLFGGITGYRDSFLETGASFWVLIVSYLWKNTGYTVVLWLAGICSLPKSLWEAAKVDGAGEMTLIFRILLPNLKGVFFTIVVLSFLNSFKVFREAYLVAGAYPQEDIYLLQNLFQNWFVKLDLDKMAAGAVLVGGFLFLFILLFDYLWEGSGLKE